MVSIRSVSGYELGLIDQTIKNRPLIGNEIVTPVAVYLTCGLQVGNMSNVVDCFGDGRGLGMERFCSIKTRGATGVILEWRYGASMFAAVARIASSVEVFWSSERVSRGSL
jgi:hypothetical protein